MPLFTFRKDERLSKKKSIDSLFSEGASFYSFPFKVYWMVTSINAGFPSQLLILVGKRSFKQAVRRNIKRFPEDFMFELSKSEIDL